MASASAAAAVEPALTQFLQRQQLASPDEHAVWTPLSGGVSSDIWRVDLPGRSLCVKRALPQLRVASEWFAPVSRNRYEWEWLLLAAQIAPQAVPQPLAHDPELGLFAMAFLPGDRYPLWKAQLLAGHVDVATAAQVGAIAGDIAQRDGGASGSRSRFRQRRQLPRAAARPLPGRHRRAPSGPGERAGRAGGAHGRRPASRWCTATSAPRTSWWDPTARCCWTPNAPGTAIRPSTSPSA